MCLRLLRLLPASELTPCLPQALPTVQCRHKTTGVRNRMKGGTPTTSAQVLRNVTQAGVP